MNINKNKKIIIATSASIFIITLGIFLFTQSSSTTSPQSDPAQTNSEHPEAANPPNQDLAQTQTPPNGEAPAAAQPADLGAPSNAAAAPNAPSSSGVFSSVKQALEHAKNSIVSTAVHPLKGIQGKFFDRSGRTKGVGTGAGKPLAAGAGTPSLPQTTALTGKNQPIQNLQANQKDQVAPTQVTRDSNRCWTSLFKHKPIESHQDGEACLQHRNQFSLPVAHGAINRASMCVKVNGVPVEFKTASPQNNLVQIAPIAGPKADVTIRYCTGPVVCTEGCTVPKDEFLSAIGGNTDNDDELSFSNKKNRKVAAHWNRNKNGPSADENALEGELDALDTESKGVNQQLNLFKDWIQKTDLEYCQGKTKSGR